MLGLPVYWKYMWTALLGFCPWIAVADGFGILSQSGDYAMYAAWTISLTSCFMSFHWIFSWQWFLSLSCLCVLQICNGSWLLHLVWARSLPTVSISIWLSFTIFLSSWLLHLDAPAVLHSLYFVLIYFIDCFCSRYNASDNTSILLQGDFCYPRLLDYCRSRSGKMWLFLEYVLIWNERPKRVLSIDALLRVHMWENLFLAQAVQIQTTGFVDQYTYERNLALIILGPCHRMLSYMGMLPSCRAPSSAGFLWPVLLRSLGVLCIGYLVGHLHFLFTLW